MGNLGFTRLDTRSRSYTMPGMTSDPSDLTPVGLVDCTFGEKRKTENKTENKHKPPASPPRLLYQTKWG